MKPTLPILIAAACSLAIAPASSAQTHDVVILGGRVMDPESGLDAIRNVAIDGNTITAVSEDPLKGKTTIRARGKVVAPGFIDLHAHGQNAESRQLQAADGVTTALELEIGVYPVKKWYDLQAGKSLINYGATVSHLGARIKVFDGIDIIHSATADPALRAKMPETRYINSVSTSEQIQQIAEMLRGGMREGALGVGFGIAYTPAASHLEIFEAFKVGVEFGAPIFVHMREGDAFSDKKFLGPVQEVIANATALGASLHIVHLGSSGSSQAKECLELIRGAAAHGVDVTTEVYPWNASSTRLESALFDGEDWEAKSGLKYSDIMWTPTGERLTKETFDKYRKIGGWVVLFGQDEALVSWLVAQPDVIIATDGIPFVDGKAHPRGAGSFGRLLGKYVREEERLDLMTALRKVTLLPAKRLEQITSAMKKKGRLQEGMDADITIFDPDTVRERATFTEPAQFTKGIEYVFVNGAMVVKKDKPVKNEFPGLPIVADAR